MIRTVCTFLAIAFALAGCFPYQSKNLGPPVYEIYRMPEEEARPLLAGKTMMTFIDVYRECDGTWVGQYYSPYCNERPGPGTQIEYLAEDGSSYLWFPGNRAVVNGQWLMLRNHEVYFICFGYGEFTRNPDTGALTGTYDTCVPLSDYAVTVVDKTEGDPFDLASGRVPFVLGRDKATIEDLLKRR